ncbi:EbsA family protein [Limosilactobacillus fermentum]|uniref:EbsA family protein n=1 Tax=Limosilactobacillus fermentum TaxID=1613 RepID=UPI0008A69863|nr:EbsA family protein [Limosilactobacillus fermentum]AOY86027.1 VPDSG-CTERM exosortase interaction domain protein [Limosilactobacillus fermentum]QID93590.1 VPDSG-CTERM exosortase interaction domain protein [Limosilactobacillus fermentum]
MKEEKTLEEQKRYFYQQDPTTAVISWSWTFIILIIGVVIWLEITHFQWITAAFLVAFFAVVALAVFRRTMTVKKDEIVFNRILQKEYMVVPLDEIRQPRFTRHTLSITVRGEVMTFTFSHRSITSLRAILTDATAQGQMESEEA